LNLHEKESDGDNVKQIKSAIWCDCCKIDIAKILSEAALDLKISHKKY